MRTTFDQELTRLHGRLVALGGMVQAQLDGALVALAARDADAAERVVRRHRQVEGQRRRVALHPEGLAGLGRQPPPGGQRLHRL